VSTHRMGCLPFNSRFDENSMREYSSHWLSPLRILFFQEFKGTYNGVYNIDSCWELFFVGILVSVQLDQHFFADHHKSHLIKNFKTFIQGWYPFPSLPFLDFFFFLEGHFVYFGTDWNRVFVPFMLMLRYLRIGGCNGRNIFASMEK